MDPDQGLQCLHMSVLSDNLIILILLSQALADFHFEGSCVEISILKGHVLTASSS